MSILIKHVAEQTFLWFESKNQYVVIDKVTGLVIEQIQNRCSLDKITDDLSLELGISLEAANKFVLDAFQFYKDHTQEVSNKIQSFPKSPKPPDHFDYYKYYKIDDVVIKVGYASTKELTLIDLKFSHLSVSPSKESKHYFRIFIDAGLIHLFVDATFVGSWSSDEVHYFQGKFSMELVQVLYGKKEREWLGVFHASAVGRNGKSMLFLGDSGNGKSTSLALLQAHGFECVADDFVPISVESQLVYKFPAAISVKRNSLPVLLPYYPVLENTQEHHLKQLSKHVRYLPPVYKNSSNRMPCIGLVFIKYDADAAFSCVELPVHKAFEKMVPDSWLSPLAENASVFLDWFTELPCYELTYHNTLEMITEVNKLYAQEL